MKAFLGAVAASFLLLIPRPAVAQQDQNDDLKTHTATGCLMKVGASNAYTLTDENGKTWDLRGSIPLNPHVGHTITVTGTIPKEATGSSDTSPQNHLMVTKVEKVRDACTQP
jgi:hypothetical protein